ncbi:unnamed protein product [Sphagnum troendelagicum]
MVDDAAVMNCGAGRRPLVSVAMEFTSPQQHSPPDPAGSRRIHVCCRPSLPPHSRKSLRRLFYLGVSSKFVHRFTAIAVLTYHK